MRKKIGYIFLLFVFTFAFVSCGRVNKKNNGIIDEDKLYFGLYPQTELIDDALISELNDIVGVPTNSDRKDWTYSSNYHMFYQNLDYDNDGIYDYRGIYFYEYMPNNYSSKSSAEDSVQDDNGYYVNTIYWFNYEPIEWDILYEEDGKALVVANLVLDNMRYHGESYTSSSFYHNGRKGYANNYELSDIRIWLNDTFYNTVFTDIEKESILRTEVDNTVSSTTQSTNDYVCNNTNDNIFLLSHEEVLEYGLFGKTFIASDYAKCRGLTITTQNVWGVFEVKGGWWLRSPDRDDATNVDFVDTSGFIYNYYLVTAYLGLRPACWIKL